jgi:hypothetical protein
VGKRDPPQPRSPTAGCSEQGCSPGKLGTSNYPLRTPRSVAENVDVFDFELTAAELKTLDALDTGVRGGPEPDDITLENFGRPIPEA